MEKEHHNSHEHRDEEKKHHDIHKHHHIHEKTHHDKKIKIDILKNFKSVKLINFLVIILGVVVVINLFLTFSVNGGAEVKVGEAKESARPAEIQLTIIENSACNDCFDLDEVISGIKKNNVEVTSEETLNFNSAQARELIKKYDVQKIPIVLVFGEVEKSGNMGLDKADDALIFTEVKAPYFDTTSNKIAGRVSVTYINDKTCEKCSDLTSFVEQLKLFGVAIVNEKIIDIKDAAVLISKYSLDKVPALIISEELSAYEDITQNWQAAGTVEKDGSYIFREINPPYFDLNKNKVVGLVNIIYLLDEKCEDCYDVEVHKQILTNPGGFNLEFESEKTIDISDDKGKELVEKYKIKGVPTVILSDDVSVYSFAESLEQFFTVEDDGSYVFTDFQAMGDIVYTDLTE
jgi:hypothetical protein